LPLKLVKTKNKQTYYFGILAEKITIFFLRIKGYEIIAWRYKTYCGEIDIIAKKSNIIIFIEVKARRSKTSLEEILKPKQVERIKKAAELFIGRNYSFQQCLLRFDLIEVNKFFMLSHHKNFVN